MTKRPLHFTLVLIATFTAHLSLAEITSPLMMLPRSPGKSSSPEPGNHYLEPSRQQEIHRPEEPPLRYKSASSAFAAAENGSDHYDPTQEHIAFITTHIQSLEETHPDELELISLLKSWVKEYEESYNKLRLEASGLFTEKIASLINVSDGIHVTSYQERKHQLLLYEYETLHNLLSAPLDLAKIKEHLERHAAAIASENAFDIARKYTLAKKECLTDIASCEEAEKNYASLKKEYLDTKERHYPEPRENTKPPKELHKLHNDVVTAGENLYSLQKSFAQLYKNSVTNKAAIKGYYETIIDAFSKSGAHFHQQATLLKSITIKPLSSEELPFYKKEAETHRLLAQSYRELAESSVQQDPSPLPKKKISFLQQKLKVLKEQLSLFQKLQSTSLSPQQNHDYYHAFRILLTAEHLFSLADNKLPPQGSLTLATALYDRGLELTHVASVFNLSSTPHAPLSTALESTIRRAKSLALHIENDAFSEAERSYFTKIVSCLYEKILTLHLYDEACELQPHLRGGSPSFYLANQLLSLLSDATACFEKLSHLPIAEYNTEEASLLLKKASQKKLQGAQLLTQLNHLLFPEEESENEGLSSWDKSD